MRSLKGKKILAVIDLKFSAIEDRSVRDQRRKKTRNRKARSSTLVALLM